MTVRTPAARISISNLTFSDEDLRQIEAYIYAGAEATANQALGRPGAPRSPK